MTDSVKGPVFSKRLKVMVLDEEAISQAGQNPTVDQWLGVILALSKRHPQAIVLDEAYQTELPASHLGILTTVSRDFGTKFYATGNSSGNALIESLKFIPDSTASLASMTPNQISLSEAFSAHFGGHGRSPAVKRAKQDLAQINPGDTVVVLGRPLISYRQLPPVVTFANDIIIKGHSFSPVPPPVRRLLPPTYTWLSLTAALCLIALAVSVRRRQRQRQPVATLQSWSPQRVHERRIVEPQTIIVAADEEQGSIIDFSFDGFGVHTSRKLVVGASVKLQLSTGNFAVDHQLEELGLQQVKGEVRWVREIKGGYRQGIQIRDLAPGQRETIQSILTNYVAGNTLPMAG